MNVRKEPVRSFPVLRAVNIDTIFNQHLRATEQSVRYYTLGLTMSSVVLKMQSRIHRQYNKVTQELRLPESSVY